MKVYQVKNWDKHFEIASSRKLKRLFWVAIPNKHDGKGYRRVSVHPRAVELFAAWVLIVEVASKMGDKKTGTGRGVLADEDGPLTAEDLAFKTGFPQSIFDLALEVLTSEKIGWLEVVSGDVT